MYTFVTSAAVKYQFHLSQCKSISKASESLLDDILSFYLNHQGEIYVYIYVLHTSIYSQSVSIYYNNKSQVLRLIPQPFSAVTQNVELVLLNFVLMCKVHYLYFVFCQFNNTNSLKNECITVFC